MKMACSQVFVQKPAHRWRYNQEVSLQQSRRRLVVGAGSAVKSRSRDPSRATGVANALRDAEVPNHNTCVC